MDEGQQILPAEDPGMTATPEEQTAAWEIYRLAKIKADSSLGFQDGRAAALAWRVFIDLFTNDPAPTPFDLHRNVVIFPAHKAPRSGGSRHDERRS